MKSRVSELAELIKSKGSAYRGEYNTAVLEDIAKSLAVIADILVKGNNKGK